MEPSNPEAQRRLTEDFEWEQSIKTFTASSDRVRYVMFVIVIAVFIAMFGWDNAREESWMGQRAKNASVALKHRLWSRPDCLSLRDPEDQQACRWLKEKGFDENALKTLAPKFEELDTQHSYYMHVPFVDATFDVNDLGLVTGLSFAFIVLVLFLSLGREHENLYLCLCRVQDKFHDDHELEDDGRSRANFFYHSLAMAQVFANPPTLGRSKRSAIDYVPGIIFFLPLLPQALILLNDSGTLAVAMSLNPAATLISFGGQVLCFVFVLLLSIGSWLLARACSIKWKRCFEILNPQHSRLSGPAWAIWLELPIGSAAGRRRP